VDDVTREPVESQDKGRGYEVAKNQYIMIEEEELEAIEIESSRTIEIDTFVPSAQIDKRYYDSPYYIAPNDQVGQEAFAVIREAMRGKDMVALGRVVLSKRERVIALEPMENGLLGTTLRYPYEVRDPAAYFDEIPDVKIAGEMLKLAEHILETKAADFEPSKFEDQYETALIELLKQKQEGFMPKSKPSEPRPSNVVNLMDALKRSLAQEGKAAVAAPAKKVSKPQKASRSKQEDLRKAPQFKLPIPGGKTKQAEQPAKIQAAKPSSRKRA
jgi:DNA end-binding protein Ku